MSVCVREIKTANIRKIMIVSSMMAIKGAPAN